MKIYRIFLIIAVCLVFNASKTFAQCGADGEQPCGSQQDFHNNRGVEYADTKRDYDEAIREYTKAIELNPQFAEAYYNRGIAYSDKKEYDAAIQDYTKAIELNPRFA